MARLRMSMLSFPRLRFSILEISVSLARRNTFCDLGVFFVDLVFLQLEAEPVRR